MPFVSRVKEREARSIQVAYENPLTEARRGNLTPGTIYLTADNVLVKLHTVYGAARKLHRSAARVQQLIERKQLRAYKIGRDWLILDLDLKHFLKAQKAKLKDRYAAYLTSKTEEGSASPNAQLGSNCEGAKRV